ncbi:MAG TPA: hypothetical protein VGE52_00650, partial [Pirellulales bacterium]
DFMTHFRERLRERLESNPAGLTFDEAVDLPSGDTCFAVSRDAAGKSIEWAMVTVGNDRVKIDSVIGKIKARVVKQKGKEKKVNAGPIAITVYEVPPTPGAAPGTPASAVQRLAHFEREGVLVFATHEGAAVEVATRWNTKPKESLSGSPTYQAVVQRLAKDAQAAGPGQGKPDVLFFIRPMAYAETVRADFPRKAPPGEPDLLEVMRNQQFHKVYGIGGTGHLDEGKYDAVIRATAYAPDIHLAENALRLLRFINRDVRAAQEWLPAGVGTYIDLTWDTDVAFEGFGSFFDEYMEEKGAWKDLIDSVREDPNGPGIDLRKDLIGLLGDRVSIVSRFVMPAGVDSRQKLVIAETKDEKKMAANIEASLKGDPKVKSRDFEGIRLHEIHDQQPPPVPGAGPKAVKIPPTAIAVANGSLLIATHVDLMETVLKKATADGVAVKAYAAATAELQTMFPGPYCLSGWFDAARNVEPSFELMRVGKLDDDHSLIGEILRRLAEDGKRNLKLDGKKLPDFAKVSPLFTGGGFAVKFEEKFGWVGQAYVLKDAAAAQTAPPTPAAPAETPAGQ